MSNFRDIALSTAQKRTQAVSQKHIPSKIWETMIFNNWTPYSRWEKKRIIEQGYERNIAFYAAANIIAQTIADIPIFVEYEKRGNTDHTNHHPILKTLERNNSREELIEALVLYFVVTGETYGHIVFNSTGREKRPLGIIPIPSQFVTPVTGDMYAPISHYEVQHYKTQNIPVHEMIHILKPDLSNPFKGMSPGVPMAETIDLMNAGITWNKNVALSGGTPPIIASAPSGASPEEAREVQDSFARQSGANNAHLLKIISGEITIHDLNTDPHDAEWGNAVLMAMRMILMSLGVSSSLMNDAANKTYNNVKDSRKALYLDACLPIADKIYKKISRCLRPYYDDNPLILPDRDKIDALQEDKSTMSKWVYEGVDRGVFTRNEARMKFGEPASTDPKADELIITNQASDKKPNDIGASPEPTNNE